MTGIGVFLARRVESSFSSSRPFQRGLVVFLIESSPILSKHTLRFISPLVPLRSSRLSSTWTAAGQCS